METPKQEPQAVLDQLAAAARRKALRSIAKERKLIANLRGDLEKHGDPELWKRYGDLLLANAGNAERKGNIVLVKDYFNDQVPTLAIEGDANLSVSEVAEDYFKRYTKARNGVAVIGERIAKAEAAIEKADVLLRQIETAVEVGDVEFLSSLIEPAKSKAPVGRKKKAEAAFKGARQFTSSDGLMILVGKKAADNDFLTFRLARSLDTWLHAADYPGSHVIVRNPNRSEIPNRTLTEAAQLAAFYSDARNQTKAAVHYTHKKFVNKPRRAAPGLVSLASFKTIMVEPKIGNVTNVK